MLVIEHRKRLIHTLAVYFHVGKDQPELPGCDILQCFQWRFPQPGCREFATLHIDLRSDADDLMAGFSRSNRYSVRRGIERDPIEFCVAEEPTADDILRFQRYYNGVMVPNGQPAANLPRLEAFASAGALRLSEAGAPGDNRKYCMHAHICDGVRARLFYSASNFRRTDDSKARAVYARANRALHWLEMMRFKEEGHSVYDFGGIALGEQDSALAEINRFKQSFGGEIVVEYHAMIPNTMLGRAVVLARGYRRRGRD